MKNKLSALMSALIALSVIACSLVNTTPARQSTSVAPTKLPATQLPTPAAVTTAPTLLTETATATPPVITGDDPVVLNAYPLDKKYYGFTNIISTPGKLWITTVTGAVLVYDPQTGQMLQEIELIDNDEHYFQGWLVNDDKYAWAMFGPSKEMKSRSDYSKRLFRITIGTGEVLPVDLPAKDTDELGRSLKDPFWLGFEASPGKLWVGGIGNLRIYDAENPENVQVIKEWWTIQNLEWDGEYMWVGMDYCSPGMFVGILDPEYKGEPCTRPVTAVDYDWIYRYEDMVWVAALDDTMNGYHIQTMLDSKFEAYNPPDVEMPFSEEHSVYANPTFDGTYLWDLNIFGTTHYYDPTDMHEVGVFNFFADGKEQGSVFDIAFDGNCIWALRMDGSGNYDLVQVGLPWSQ